MIIAKVIYKLAAYFDRKGDTFGEWYTRCLIGFLFAWCALGFVAGMMLQFVLR
jgi:hypothetical protein